MLHSSCLSHPLRWSHSSGDGATYQIRYISGLAIPPSSPHPFFQIAEISLSAIPSVIYFFVPGNPGVTSAYLPWFLHLSAQVNGDILICISSHLGHLAEARGMFDFTCEDNIEHQLKVFSRLVDSVRQNVADSRGQMPKFVVAGHSAGAYFAVHALSRYLRRSPTMPANFKANLKLILYCGTLIRFANSGLLKAVIAASESGRKLMIYVRNGGWLKKIAFQEEFTTMMYNELTDGLIANISSLTQSELEQLPRENSDQLDLLEKLGINAFFLFALNDPYVPKKVMEQYIERFGSDHVYIGEKWWHAFVLHKEGFTDAAHITKTAIQEERLPVEIQRAMPPWTLGSLIFDLRSMAAAFLVSCWLACSSLPDTVRNMEPQHFEKGRAEETVHCNPQQQPVVVVSRSS